MTALPRRIVMIPRPPPEEMMRTTLRIDDGQLAAARDLSGIDGR